MEMVMAAAALAVSVFTLALAAACAVWLLMMATPKEERAENELSKPSAPTKSGIDTPENVEKRRRLAVQAREHQNFMDYDGTEQVPIDPNTILADGG